LNQENQVGKFYLLIIYNFDSSFHFGYNFLS